MSRLTNQRGYTLTELLISTAIMMVVTGAIFGLMNPASGSAQAQPEVADLQQRMRVGSEVLFKELVMAGAGPYQGATTGSLINFFAPILPRRTGRLSPDPTRGPASFRTDAITLAYIPNSYSQTSITSPMPLPSAELKVEDRPNCPQGRELCGFEEGMTVIIFDTSGHFDTFTITQVQDEAGHLQHHGQDLSIAYSTGANITQIVSNTYYLNRTTNQLMQYDGAATDVPLVDNVVDLRFDYFGDINPPRNPRPPAGVANCLYDAVGNYANLPVLAPDAGSLASLPAAMLSDGPYCGGGQNEFDADLLRVRKIRITIRMQTASPALRGRDTSLFLRPGTAIGGERFVPDYTVTFDVTPRNLNLSR
jgi:hypothetical protein